MLKWRSVKKIVGIGTCVTGLGLGSFMYYRMKNLQRASVLHVSAETEDLNANYPDRMFVPPRSELLDKLKKEGFDVLVIGGGATGVGVALDSQTRGLNTALVEMHDFAAATSSRSTKLIHGGVRYLQAAVMGLDLAQYRMVEEALSERAHMLGAAPHLSYPLPILLPVKQWFMIPYYWAGVKAYDFVSGRQCLHSSYAIGKKEALRLFPMIKSDISGALVYFDGGQNDSRMALCVALTAIRFGATAVNHVEVTQLVKSVDEKTKKLVVRGAKCRDMLTGEEFTVNAKCVINATGPFTDKIRAMDDSGVKPITQPSSGVHITLPGFYSPEKMGLLDPSTSDGRVVFFLPWQRHTIAGTTDEKCTTDTGQIPTEAAIQFLLREIQGHLAEDVFIRRGDVLSAWSGIRPLVRDPNAKDTKSLARNHIIEVSGSNMITIAGGKWTTYRKMAEETVDKAIEICDLKPKSLKCRTLGLKVEGAHQYTPNMHIKLSQDYGLNWEIAEHLATTYGDKAYRVARRCGLTGMKWPLIGNRIHPNHPFVDGEVIYAVQREYAATLIDVIARRVNIAFRNADNAEESLETIAKLMAKYLNWDKRKVQDEIDNAKRFLRREMGIDLAKQNLQGRIEQSLLSDEEKKRYTQLFGLLDREKKGFLTLRDVKSMFDDYPDVCEKGLYFLVFFYERLHSILFFVSVPTDQLSEILMEVDTNKSGQVQLEEFLSLMDRLKGGHKGDGSSNRFAAAAKLVSDIPGLFPGERSGGGL